MEPDPLALYVGNVSQMYLISILELGLTKTSMFLLGALARMDGPHRIIQLKSTVALYGTVLMTLAYDVSSYKFAVLRL